MRAGSILMVTTIGLLASGCETSDIATNYQTLGDATVLVTRPSSRLVTERQRFIGDRPTSVLCTEPSPDVAIAQARSGNLSGTGSAPTGPSVSLSGGFTSNETASLLAGRTAGVVALRDGLYVACQAYVNGVIGHDSYAIILSQYGKLLIELVGSGSSGDKGSSDKGSSDKGGGSSTTAAPGAIVLTVAGGSITSPTSNSGKSGALAPSNGDKSAPATYPARDDLLLIACIAEFDPTRIVPLQPGTNIPIRNELLDRNCRKFVERISSGPAQPSDPSRPRTQTRTRQPL